MKHTFFIFMLLASRVVYAQTNTLPATGNVGIGTTTPNTALDVKGSVNIDSILIVKDSIIIESSAKILEDITVNGTTRLEDNTSMIKDLTVDGTTKLNGSLQANGSVYFTNTPLSTNPNPLVKFLILDSNGIVKSFGLNEMNDLFNPQFVVCISDQNGNIPDPHWKSGINKLFIDCPQVNVGIGTDNPTHRFTVIGDQYLEGTTELNGVMGIGSSPSGFSRIKIDNGNYGAGIEIVGNNQVYNKLLFLHVKNPNTEVIKVYNDITNHVPFLLEANGKMTISNGTQKILQLNSDGVLQTRVVKVDTYNWPDYVFEQEYSLMPLNDLREFVIKNKHLPEIPNAKFNETNGVDIGEMNKLLLKKIEELTLYLIEQEQRISILENKLKVEGQ